MIDENIIFDFCIHIISSNWLLVLKNFVCAGSEAWCRVKLNCKSTSAEFDPTLSRGAV